MNAILRSVILWAGWKLGYMDRCDDCGMYLSQNRVLRRDLCSKCQTNADIDKTREMLEEMNNE